jgi:hypothetical protein
MEKTKELDEPSNLHHNKNNDQPELLHYANGFLVRILSDLFNDKFITKLDSPIFRIASMSDIYEKIRTNGKIHSINLNGTRIADRIDHKVDTIKLIEYIIHYNNVTRIELEHYIIDVKLLIFLFKIRNLVHLGFHNCLFHRHVFFILIVLLFEDIDRMVYLKTYFENITPHVISNISDTRIVSWDDIFSEIASLKSSNLKILSINSKIINQIINIAYKQPDLEHKLFDQAVRIMFETNCHLRTLYFPTECEFNRKPCYMQFIDANYSILGTNISRKMTTVARNIQLLSTTRKSCLLLIGIKKFRKNDSKEFKYLAVLDPNIVRLIAKSVYSILKNNRRHLTLLALSLKQKLF